jgi:hypothetical protein
MSHSTPGKLAIQERRLCALICDFRRLAGSLHNFLILGAFGIRAGCGCSQAAWAIEIATAVTFSLRILASRR